MRFRISEITLQRIWDAGLHRLKDIHHSIEWHRSTLLTIENQKRLEVFRGKHKGERCFILANGPSLNLMQLSSLRNEITFGMNRIYLLFDQLGFSTTYFSCVNDLVLEQFAEDINELKIPKFLNWNMRSLYSSRDENIIFLKFHSGIRDYFGKDLTTKISGGGTVTFACLQIAYYMGFDEVVLIGLDHKFAEKGRPNKKEVRTADRDESHFHPNYFPKGYKWQLPDLLRSEMAYLLARKMFESDGRRIIDATVGGHCQVFEKVDFASCLLGAKT